jgi:hypothetical protein
MLYEASLLQGIKRISRSIVGLRNLQYFLMDQILRKLNQDGAIIWRRALSRMKNLKGVKISLENYDSVNLVNELK